MIVAGISAAIMAGFAEIVWIASVPGLPIFWSSLFSTLATYALCGFLLACPLAIARVSTNPGRLSLRPGAWEAGTFALVLLAICGVVLRHRYIRDLLHEGSLSLPANIAWIGAVVLCAGILFRLARPLFARRPIAGPVALPFVGLLAFALARPLLPVPEAERTTKAPTGNPRNRPDILYIMVDTLRADALGSFGATPGNTPAMDALAADGIVFDQAISAAPWTRPSVASQLTSLHPVRHGARHKSSHIAEDAISLTQVLAANGYETVGFRNNGHLHGALGFARGFHRYESALAGVGAERWQPGNQSMVYRQFYNLTARLGEAKPKFGEYYAPAETLFELARRTIEERPGDAAPLFLFLHAYDPHDPYFDHSDQRADPILRTGNERPGNEQIERMQRRYHGEIEYLDQHLGRFLSWLAAQERYEETIIVLVADHGEEFQEHGHSWHGLSVYEEQIHVPLIVKPAGRALAGRRQSALVSSLDIAPTIVSLAGIPAPRSWEGQSLVADRELVAPERDFVSSETDLEGTLLRTARGEDEKLIVSRGNHWRQHPRAEFFDLADDPEERDERSASRPDRVQALEDWLRSERGIDLAR